MSFTLNLSMPNIVSACNRCSIKMFASFSITQVVIAELELEPVAPHYLFIVTSTIISL